MTKLLMPYGDKKNSDIVAKNGAHLGTPVPMPSPDKVLRTRIVGGREVVRVRRIAV